MPDSIRVCRSSVHTKPEQATQDVQVFHFGGYGLRAVKIGGEPWFIAKDVCDVLRLTNPSVALAVLDVDERAKLNLGQRGMGAVNIVNESGLYALVMQTRKPEAKQFRKWVTGTVLPAIRKDGAYVEIVARFSAR